jgi:hypothetical protein
MLSGQKCFSGCSVKDVNDITKSAPKRQHGTIMALTFYYLLESSDLPDDKKAKDFFKSDY